jgi:hypothetical protein
MILTLEALNALHGDALLLHFGGDESPELIVIDGGPRTVYPQTMRARLQALRQGRSRGLTPPPPLDIRLLMVSHMDRDHIAGVIDLLKDLDTRLTKNEDEPYRIQSLWHNSFEDLVKATPSEADGARTAALAGNDQPLPGFEDLTTHGALVLASIGEGREVRRLASKLKIENLENQDHGTDLVVLPEGDKRSDQFGDLTLTVLGPPSGRVDKLRKEWAKAVKKNDKVKAASLAGNDAIDHSVFNLSSIVVLAESGGRRMLLTGDARGDDIMAGLRAAKLLDKKGQIHVDLLKLPHHGSNRNVNAEFFDCVRADHYLVSANGRDGNPDLATFELLTDSRNGDEYTVHVTNEIDVLSGGVNASITFLRGLLKAGERFKLEIRPAAEPSMMVHLGTPLAGAKPGGDGPSKPARRPKKKTPSPKARKPKHTD